MVSELFIKYSDDLLNVNMNANLEQFVELLFPRDNRLFHNTDIDNELLQDRCDWKYMV